MKENELEKLLGQRVASYRRAARLTQAVLAERIGVATETISRLERGAVIPPIVRLNDIAKACGVTLVELFRYAEDDHERRRAIDRLVTIVAHRGSTEIEVIAEIAERIFRQW